MLVTYSVVYFYCILVVWFCLVCLCWLWWVWFIARLWFAFDYCLDWIVVVLCSWCYCDCALFGLLLLFKVWCDYFAIVYVCLVFCILLVCLLTLCVWLFVLCILIVLWWNSSFLCIIFIECVGCSLLCLLVRSWFDCWLFACVDVGFDYLFGWYLLLWL